LTSTTLLFLASPLARMPDHQFGQEIPGW